MTPSTEVKVECPRLPDEMIEHISLLTHDIDTFSAMCIVFPALHKRAHHPIGKSYYIDHFTIKYTFAYCTHWTFRGKLHRENNLPAIEWTGGTREWYHRGKRHRDNDLPAIESYNGDRGWYQRGKLHRDNDLPAIQHGRMSSCH